MTLGSLFDGVGTWQEAARRAGIKPVWSAEIEKFPLAVTARHFPDTVQLGDVNTITDAPHVDIVTAGTPCQGINAQFKPNICEELQPSLTAKGPAAVCHLSVVRRLTPLECERLMGLPDGWTEGGSDAARYKAIGNGMALLIAEWIMKRIKGVAKWELR